MALLFQIADCLREFYGSARMTSPVAGIGGFRSSNGLSGNGRDKGLRWRAQLDLGNGLAQRFNHGIHHCGVEGMRGVQVSTNDIFGLELLLE